MKRIINVVFVSILVFIIFFKVHARVLDEVSKFFKVDFMVSYIPSQFTHNILFALAFGIIPIVSYIIFTYYHIKSYLFIFIFILLSTIVVSLSRLYYVFRIIYPAHDIYPIEEIKFEKYLHYGWMIGAFLVSLILFISSKREPPATASAKTVD